jgi:hypothetical protein
VIPLPYSSQLDGTQDRGQSPRRCDRTSINKIEHGQQLPDRPFWQAADKLLHADGALLKRYD